MPRCRGEALMCRLHVNELMLRCCRMTTRMKTCMHPTGRALRARGDSGRCRASAAVRIGACGASWAMRYCSIESGQRRSDRRRARYVYVIERGPLPAAGRAEGNG